MHARIVTANVEPGRVDDFLKYFQEELVPHVKEDPGFKNLYMLTDQLTSRIVSLALYESEDDIKASDPRFEERIEKIAEAGFLSERPTSESLEVGLQI